MLPLIGADRLLFGSDFPHLDHGGEVVEQAVSLEGRVPQATLRQLLSENAARFFGLGV
jgi:predicted TIM-barrel fold metal-dependent hydrolase